MASKTPKSRIIQRLFDERYHPATGELPDPVVTLEQVSAAIRADNAEFPSPRPMSDRNPANFYKDFIRNRESANRNWPPAIFDAGFTGRQVTGKGLCFEFVRVMPGQAEAFPTNLFPLPSESTPVHRIESASLPLASRKLGRRDEPWLIQVLVRLRVIETHMCLFSPHRLDQVDHLQMSVKLSRSEIDALFLGLKLVDGEPRELIICCEAKGLRDDILEDQVLRQVCEVFQIRGVTQDIAIPVVVKAIGPSRVHVREFEAISRSQAAQSPSLIMASEAVYELVPPVPGIGI